MVITPDMLTPYQQGLAKRFNIKAGGMKLCLSLFKKKNYICNYRSLKYFLSKGLRLEKVHRVLHYDQAPLLRGYIKLNTEMRQRATTAFEKEFAKLMNNR